jgi:hypothetical protein
MCQLTLTVSVGLNTVHVLHRPWQFALVQFPVRFSHVAAQGISTTTIHAIAAESISAKH